ncbi:hypothetical protein LRR80_02658 [Streptomyces sp. RO-S4]|nr:hypothetical protein [Streptomyces sp. RO-S4]
MSGAATVTPTHREGVSGAATVALTELDWTKPLTALSVTS